MLLYLAPRAIILFSRRVFFARSRVLLSICLCMGLCTAAQAEEQMNFVPRDATGTIGAIRFEGNDVTKDIILRQELLIEPGEAINYDRIEQSRQAIMNLGLFKRVTARLEPGGEAQDVVFKVDEKWYILPIPKLDRDSDGDYSYGFELQWDNFLGYNQSLELLSETEETSDGLIKKKREFSYDIPRIPHSHFGFALLLRRELSTPEIEDEVLGVGQYDLAEKRASVTVSRWLTRDGPSRGWRGRVGSNYSDRDYTYLNGVEGLIDDRKIVEAWVGATFHDVYEYPWHREGREYGWVFTTAGHGLGSDDDYHRVDLFHRSYVYPVFWDNDNINTQVRLGYGHGYDRQSDPYSIGSADTLRGYERDNLNGDILALVNIEYMKPAFGTRNVRGVLFADAGNVYEEGEVDLTDLEYAAGFGLRWKIRALVRTDLRIDVAWGFGEEDYKVYAGTRHTF